MERDSHFVKARNSDVTVTRGRATPGSEQCFRNRDRWRPFRRFCRPPASANSQRRCWPAFPSPTTCCPARIGTICRQAKLFGAEMSSAVCTTSTGWKRWRHEARMGLLRSRVCLPRHLAQKVPQFNVKKSICAADPVLVMEGLRAGSSWVFPRAPLL